MVSKTFNRYIWLLNTLLQWKRLTYEEISHLWQNSTMGDGNPMPLRTFHQHRTAVEELFNININCDTKNGYVYYVAAPQQLQKDFASQWLLNSFSLSNMISAGRNMQDKILFEEVPRGTEYLQTLIDAIQQNVVLTVEYCSFENHHSVYRLHPYAMKVFHQRWYVLGYLEEHDHIRHLALDRVLRMEPTSESFEYPADFNAADYYNDYIGIFVNDALIPQKVVLRVYGLQVEYLRTLPLHHTQREVVTTPEYSDFEFEICLSPEVTSFILSLGDLIEVLAPQELREKVQQRLLSTLNRYKS